MSYVPRNPRRITKLRAVLDDGRTGSVRNMSTSGLLVDTAESRSSALTVGRRIAVVPLVGDLDGERLPAEVARVGEQGLAVRFIGLNPEHRQRLRSIFTANEKLLLARAPSLIPLPVIPEGAPVIILTDEPAPVVVVETRASAGREVREQMERIEELEGQLFEMIRDKSTLLQENGALKQRVSMLTARSVLLTRVQDDLYEANETLLEVERAHDALFQNLLQELQRLERIISGC